MFIVGAHSATTIADVLEQMDRPGRMGGPQKAGPEGNCVCPSCGFRVPHSRANPCDERACPKCGAQMTREETAASVQGANGKRLTLAAPPKKAMQHDRLTL